MVVNVVIETYRDCYAGEAVKEVNEVIKYHAWISKTAPVTKLPQTLPILFVEEK